MEKNKVLAIVAGEEITNADLDGFLKNVPMEQRGYASNPQYRDSFLDRLIIYRAYAKMAEEQKMDETEEFKKIMENARKEFLAQFAINQVLKDITVSEEEIEQFYGANAQHFINGETVNAKHILVKEEQECIKIFAKIAKNEISFEDAAKEYSTCPSGERGGDLGEFGKGQMVKEFEDAAFSGEVGQVLGPVKTQFGYHLIKVEERKEASIVPLDEVHEKIEKMLMQQKQNQVYTEKAAELKEKYVEMK